MKKQLLSFILFITVIITSAQSWRDGEMQIRIPVNNQEQVQQLAELKLNMDFYGPAFDHIIAYVVPKELDQINALGITYEIEISDLNKHNLDFWQTKDAYHSYDEIIELADSLVTHFPDICERFVFGMDASDQYELTALKISDNVTVDEPEAEVMFDGGIHGDEVGAAENVIRFARDLCLGYDDDPDITFLINNREIWLYLMVNPWGRVADSRYNSNGVDLNRDWCYMWDGAGGSSGPCSQLESKALRDCMYNNQFVVHTTYHSGTEYISCPWSYRPDVPHDAPHILQLAGLYASESGYANMEYGQGYSGMYAINGSTKDSNYGIMGSISWSMEISYSKHPPASQIMQYYNYNVPSMLAMIEYSGYGLEGIVTDAVTGNPVQAVVFVNDFLPTFTDATAGDYHKFVLPGIYSITIVANGYATQTINNIEVSSNSSTSTDFELQPEDGQYVYRFSASQIPDNNHNDEGWTPAVIGEPDEINYSIGKDGWCVLDMQYPVIDGPGIDIIIWEGDNSPEGFTCYAGETLDGPWMSLGTGNGTTEFDMAGSGISEARFIKIMDDGDGNANAADAGFDLDAIEALEPVSGIYIALYDYVIDDSQGNNNGRIDPGETVDIIVTLKNNGDIVAENTVGTISSSSPYITIDNNSSNFGNLEQGQSEEGTYTITANAGTPIGEPVAINLNVDATSYNTTFMISFSVGLIVEDWETGNFEQFEWETDGNANWEISTQNPYEGTYCVKSGTISDDQSTWLSISYDVIASGEIGFFKKVSSEDTYDFLKFYIDGTMMDQWSGEVSWGESSYPVTTGSHTFKWEFEKDQSVASGSDCAWIDYISLPSGALSSIYASFTSDVTDICEDDMVHFQDASSGGVISWDWVFEGGTPATSNDQNPVVGYSGEGTFDVSLTVSDGTNSNTLVLESFIEVDMEPEIPEVPEGPVVVGSYPGSTSEYMTTEFANVDGYDWYLDPVSAGVLTVDGHVCIVDWQNYYEGTVYLKVRTVNNCGESNYSDNLQIDVILTDINDNESVGIQVFPNPNNGEFTIHLGQSNSNPWQVKIYNSIGKAVYVSNVESLSDGNMVVDLDNIDSGVYFIIVRSDEIALQKKMIIK